MRIALDTNVLIYAAGFNSPDRVLETERMLFRLRDMSMIVPVQVLGEMFRVLVGKAQLKIPEAAQKVRAVEDNFEVTPTTLPAWRGAMEIVTRHSVSIWDAVILSVASEAGCALLLSEDYQEGFAWRGVTIVNPFADKPHRLLARALREEGK